ncbi:unnamed protein product [Sphagnum balticum]
MFAAVALGLRLGEDFCMPNVKNSSQEFRYAKSIDVSKAREDTPACKTLTHFNNAGASLMPSQVVDTIISHIELEARIGGYEAADRRHDETEKVYGLFAKLLNCQPEEMAIVENATRAWDMAIYSMSFKPGDRILTGIAEYGSNYIGLLQICQRTGAQLELIPNDEFGQLSTTHLENTLDSRVKLIALTHVPTNSGLVNPAARVGEIAFAANVPYVLDACQSVGQMPIDVEEIGCDILCGTGRKYLRGPRGTGFLYVRKSLIEKLEPPFLDIHATDSHNKHNYQIRSDARRFENWETNISTKLGLATALEYAMQWDLMAIKARVFELAETFRQKLSSLAKVRVLDIGFEKCGIVTFEVDGFEAPSVRAMLQEETSTYRFPGSAQAQSTWQIEG